MPSLEAKREFMMRCWRVTAFVMFTAMAPFHFAAAQKAEMPELDEVREWLHAHQPRMISGDSGLNATIVIVDTNAKYVRSIAFALGPAELERANGGMMRAAGLQGDTASANLLWACQRTTTRATPTADRPVCVL